MVRTVENNDSKITIFFEILKRRVAILHTESFVASGLGQIQWLRLIEFFNLSETMKTNERKKQE